MYTLSPDHSFAFLKIQHPPTSSPYGAMVYLNLMIKNYHLLNAPSLLFARASPHNLCKMFLLRAQVFALGRKMLRFGRKLLRFGRKLLRPYRLLT